MSAIDNIRVADLTVGQLADLVRGIVAEAVNGQRKEPEETVIREDYTRGRYVYGIDGIAALLGVSKTTAQKIKSDGLLRDAISQHGRKIVCDAKLAVELFGARPKRKLLTL